MELRLRASAFAQPFGGIQEDSSSSVILRSRGRDNVLSPRISSAWRKECKDAHL
jgi:hypothetical protein